MSASKTRAKRLLVHYVRVAFEKAGAQWDADNQAEVEELVDALVQASVDATLHRLDRIERHGA